MKWFKKNMIRFYRPISIAPRFWFVAAGLMLTSFFCGRLVAPPYLEYLRTHHGERTFSLLSPKQIVGHGYAPPTGDELIKERQAAFVLLKGFWLSNVASCTICLSLGTLLFFFPSLWITLQGFYFGLLSFIDGWSMFFWAIMPHALLEFPVVVFTAAAATQIGWTILWSWRTGLTRAFAGQLRSLAVVWLQVSCLLLISAILETYVRLYVFL